MAKNRSENGQFTRNPGSGPSESTAPSTAPGKFDLVGSLRTLFATAQKEGDYTGASSLARAIRDFEKKEPDDHASRREYQDRVVSLMSSAERTAYVATRQEMGVLYTRRAVILTRAAIRNGIVPIFPVLCSTAACERLVKLATSTDESIDADVTNGSNEEVI